MTDERIPAEVFPVGEFIRDECEERGWTLEELADRMGGDWGTNLLVLEFATVAPKKGVTLGEGTAEQLARAFGTSARLWLNLDRTWQKYGPADTEGAE